MKIPMQGVALTATPLFLNEKAGVSASLVGLGLYELAAVMTTETGPGR